MWKDLLFKIFIQLVVVCRIKRKLNKIRFYFNRKIFCFFIELELIIIPPFTKSQNFIQYLIFESFRKTWFSFNVFYVTVDFSHSSPHSRIEVILNAVIRAPRNVAANLWPFVPKLKMKFKQDFVLFSTPVLTSFDSGIQLISPSTFCQMYLYRHCFPVFRLLGFLSLILAAISFQVASTEFSFIWVRMSIKSLSSWIYFGLLVWSNFCFLFDSL